jgi:hypothetical protein
VHDDITTKLMTNAEASYHAGVGVEAIRQWVKRGHLEVAARDMRGRPLYRWIDVAKAEHKTRKHARRDHSYRVAA